MLFRSSLNTLKTASNEYLEGGYKTLDQLRLNALTAIEYYSEHKKTGNKNTKKSLLTKIKEQKNHIQLLEQQNMMLVYLLCELKDNATKYASEGPASIQAICKREMDYINAKISFSGNADLISKSLKNEKPKTL